MHIIPVMKRRPMLLFYALTNTLLSIIRETSIFIYLLSPAPAQPFPKVDYTVGPLLFLRIKLKKNLLLSIQFNSYV